MATKKAAHKPVKRAAPARRSAANDTESRGSFDNGAPQGPQQSAPYNQGRANFNGGGNRNWGHRGASKPSAFTSVTGLWPGKKANTIGSGKCKGEQLEKILAVLQEALQKGVEVRFSVFAPGQYTHAQAMGDLAISLVDPNYSGGGRSAGGGYSQRPAPAPAPQRGNFRQPNQGWEQPANDNDGKCVNFG